MILTLLVALSLSAARGPVVFGDERRWYVLARDGSLIEEVGEIGGLRLKDLAVSPDGKTRAFVPASMPQLRLWRADWPAPIEIPNDGDVAQSPTFSDDGKWVFYVQNSLKKHGPAVPMRYAQIWRVPSIGGPAVQLTHANGCHLSPTMSSSTSVLFTHATCQGGRGLGLLDLRRGTERLLLPQKGENGMGLLSADARVVVFTRQDATGISLHWRDTAKGKELRSDTLMSGATDPRLAWAQDETVLYQAGGKVWKATMSGEQSLVLVMNGSDP